MTDNNITDKDFLEEPPVYNRISDAMESEFQADIKLYQNKIILDNTQKAGNNIGLAKEPHSSRRKLFRRYNKLSFINDSYTAGGFISCALVLVSLALTIYSLAMTVKLRGNVGATVAFCTLFSFVISIFGFLIGIRSFGEEDKKYLFSRIGSYSSLAISVFWIIMYLRGLFLTKP